MCQSIYSKQIIIQVSQTIAIHPSRPNTHSHNKNKQEEDSKVEEKGAAEDAEEAEAPAEEDRVI
jgi:hypothetical protein